MPGLKGPRGPIGVFQARDVGKACSVFGGRVFRGVCLKGISLQGNFDNVPLGCAAYVPDMMWGEAQYKEIFRLFGNQVPR